MKETTISAHFNVSPTTLNCFMLELDKSIFNDTMIEAIRLAKLFYQTKFVPIANQKLEDLMIEQVGSQTDISVEFFQSMLEAKTQEIYSFYMDLLNDGNTVEIDDDHEDHINGCIFNVMSCLFTDLTADPNKLYELAVIDIEIPGTLFRWNMDIESGLLTLMFTTTTLF